MDSLNQDASIPALEYFPSASDDHADSPSPVVLHVYSILNDGHISVDQNDKINNQVKFDFRFDISVHCNNVGNSYFSTGTGCK